MEKFFICVLAVTFFTITSGVPTWEYEDDVTPSSLEITHRRCSCAKHHHECGCCLRIKAHPFHKRIDADVCMNASYVESPLGAEFFLTWNKDVLFNKTISAADPPPICFGIPHLRFAKACVKFSNVSIEKHNTGGCVALEFKGFDAGRDIRLGCFFFRGANSNGFDMETFLDTESLHSLLEEVFQASTGGQIDTARIPYLETMDDDVTDLVTVDKAGCECGKTPPHCDCCVQAKVFHFPVKACVHGDVGESDTGFNVAVIVNGLTVFKKHISVANPPPICHEFRIFHTKTKICLKLTEVSLAPGHTGACVEVDINSFKRSLGCFYMARQVTKERSTWLARHHG